MSEEMRYIFFLIEKTAVRTGVSGTDIFRQIKNNNLLPYLKAMFETYHTESTDNAVSDLVAKLEAVQFQKQ